MNLSTPGQVIGRLTEIENDLQQRQNTYEEAAENYYRAKRDYELAFARERLAASGTKDERSDRALLELAKSDTYKDLIVAEAAFEGAKAAVKVLETRATIGQSILRAQSRA